MKKITNLLLILVLILSFTAIPVASNKVNVEVDGSIINFTDTQPFVDKNSRTLVPVRFIAEKLGSNVSWDGQKQEVGITGRGKDIRLKIGENKANLNGETIMLDTSAILRDNRTFVPLRFISEALGTKIEWVAKTNTVKITTAEPKTTELTEEDIKRLQSYPLNLAYYLEKSALDSYEGFEERYAKKLGDCEGIFKDQLWTPINYPPKEFKGKTSNIKWISSPRLIYYGPGYGIRGIVQKTESGKVYEADFEILIVNTTEGTYLLDDKWGKDYSGRLSEWKEVK